jgi:tRNA(Ile)-lysidine synthase
MRSMSAFQGLKQTVVRNFPTSRQYMVGVSGGRDSVTLLHWLIENGYQRLTVCHLNHRLRSRASDADAKFVKKIAAQYGFDFETQAADVRDLALKKKLSIEAAAREARYAFFFDVAKRRRCRTIFLGHHADDLVETFLINLFRGAGTTGLSAMRSVARRRIRNVDLTIVRPLLSIWRNEIDKYVREHRLEFREDRTNRDLSILRNRVRRRIVPYLEKTIGRKIRENIWRTAAILAEEENFFDLLVVDKSSDAARLAVKPLRKMGVALQRRVLHKWLREADVADVGFDLVERVRALVDLTAGVAKTNLPRNRYARRRAGMLFLE